MSGPSRRDVLLLCAAVALLPACAPSMEANPTPRPPMRLVSAENLHLLGAWTDDSLIYAQGEAWPQEKQPWPAVYRTSVAGGPPELLGRDVYRLLIKRPRAAGDPPPMLSYLTPDTPGEQTLHSTAHLWICRPGEPPKEIATADPPLVLQPGLLSPDNRYLLSYGKNPDPAFFSIDLTDLTTGASRRIGFALSVTVPRWLGFDGSGRRYLLLPNLEGRRPYALFRLGEGADQELPLVLPGRMAGLLPDGRGVLEGDDLVALELRPGGATTKLAPGPVQDLSAFVRGGAAYFIAAKMAQQGPLQRVEPGQQPQVLHASAAYLWFASAMGGVAYVADEWTDKGRGLRAVELPAGPTTLLSAAPVGSYKPLRGDGVAFFPAAGGAAVWDRGLLGVLSLGPRVRAAWQLPDGRFAVVEYEGAGPSGDLRVVGGEGPAEALDTGVDLADGAGAPGEVLLVYSVPKGEGRAGIWVRQVPALKFSR